MELSAGAVLQLQRADKNTDLRLRQTRGKTVERLLPIAAQRSLIHRTAQFAGERLGSFARQQFECGRQGVDRANGTRQRVKRVRELLLNQLQLLAAAAQHHQIRNG